MSAVHVESGMVGHVQTSAISNQISSAFYSWYCKSCFNGLNIRKNIPHISTLAHIFSPAEEHVVYLHNPEFHLFTCPEFCCFKKQAHIIILGTDNHRSKYSVNKCEFLSKWGKCHKPWVLWVVSCVEIWILLKQNERLSRLKSHHRK